MNEYYGIYNTTLGRWAMNGNSLIYYPVREIAEAQVSMMGKEHHFEVRAFKKSEETNQKKKNAGK